MSTLSSLPHYLLNFPTLRVLPIFIFVFRQAVFALLYCSELYWSYEESHHRKNLMFLISIAIYQFPVVPDRFFCPCLPLHTCLLFGWRGIMCHNCCWFTIILSLYLENIVFFKLSTTSRGKQNKTPN